MERKSSAKAAVYARLGGPWRCSRRLVWGASRRRNRQHWRNIIGRIIRVIIWQTDKLHLHLTQTLWPVNCDLCKGQKERKSSTSRQPRHCRRRWFQVTI